MGHRIGDGRHRWHDRRFADTAHAIGVPRVWHLDDHRVDHWQVGGHGHAVIEEAGVLQLAILAVDVLLVQRPADTLRHATLILALDVTGMDRPARILDGRVADHRDLAGLRINLDVGDVGGKAGGGTSGVDAGIADDRTAGLTGDAGDLLQAHRCVLAGIGAGGAHAAVAVLDRILGQLPQLRRALTGFLHDVASGFYRRHATGERRTAAAGEEVVAELAGVADLHTDLVQWHTQLFRRHHAQGGTQATDIRRAGGERQGAIFVEPQRHRGFAADIEPEAARHPTTLVLAERRAPMGVRLGGLQGLDHADRPEFGPVGGLGPLPGGVLQPELDRIDADFAGDFIDHAFDGKLGNRPARCAVGRHLWPVGDDVVADHLDVFDVVGRVGAHGARLHRRAGEGARLILEFGLRSEEHTSEL